MAEREGRSARATWGPWHGSLRLLRIDHGFVAGLRVHDFNVVPVPKADHCAIVMNVASDVGSDT